MTEVAPITLFWFRRDLRLHDNHGLYRALRDQGNVQPLFIFDQDILEKLEDRDDRRVSFLHDRIGVLHEELGRSGASLWVEVGRPLEVIAKLIAQHPIAAIYTNHDHEPYGMARDAAIGDLLRKKGIDLRTFKDVSIHERDEVVKDDGTPYTVFTPYMRKWKARTSAEGIPSFPSELLTDAFRKAKPSPLLSIQAIGFEHHAYAAPAFIPTVPMLHGYALDRNTPGIAGTSRMGVHLRFGTVSVRELVRLAMKHSEAWLNELIWREFFMQVLWHFPHVVNGSFRRQYDAIPWRDDEEGFKAWCEGQTGFPLVDAGMRELRATGFMHNRVRMVVAGFLCKHLLIDWRWGEAWFARWLMDFELSSNNGNWQWAAGSGCDATPYFRVFSPDAQMKRFDPELSYVLKWAPEYGSLSPIAPMVDHRFARERAIRSYRSALVK
ncbi:MAG: deoxyribodipyrimidine photo-lyase [Flavobacteriales bacterium]|nr:deoxyribodipyrimidine photo-lyase [Flavobacteriales bacterium]